MERKSVFIIGAGIAGCALASLLGEQNFKVTVFEKRTDVTQLTSKHGRTINMLLSPRGAQVIEECGILDEILARFPKIYGRMVHANKAGPSFVPYALRKSDDWYNISIARNELVDLLIKKATANGVKFNFGYELLSLQVSKEQATCQFLSNTDSVYKLSCDLVVGADGLYSAVRARIPTSVSQYITDYCYKELTIAPSPTTGKFIMDPHSIHVFPRGKYFMIALPNEDYTFRCTLVMPSKGAQALSNIKTTQEANQFISQNFPDVPVTSFINLEEFVSSPINPLWSVMCAEYHSKDRVVLLGDAAHTILPFLGQGMNLALEDVHVLNSLIKNNRDHTDFSKILPEYTRLRKCDADAIQTLSEVNFQELSANVQSKSFQLQKKIELALHSLMPNLFAPSPFIIANFSGLPYSSVKEKVENSSRLMNELIFTTKMLGLSFVGKVLLSSLSLKPSKFLAKL